MNRKFCDACGTEIAQNYVTNRLTGTRKFRLDGKVVEVTVDVMAGVGVPSPGGARINQGDLCRDCVIDTVLALDTRPRDAEDVG